MVLSLEQINTNQAAKIEKLKKRVKKLEGKKKKKKRTQGLKRLYKVGMSARIISFDKEELGDQEDAFKHGRIAEIDADKDHSLINETAQDQGRMNEEDLFGVNVLDGDEVVVDVSAGEKEEHSEKVVKKEVSTADLVTTADPNYELAAKLQEEERGELSIKEKSKLFVELMNKRKKHFKMLRAEERIRRPPTKAQKRKQMCTYLKNMAGFTHNQLKIKDKAGDEIEQESAKKQKLDENIQAEVADDDNAELKNAWK
nr:hypothetical protein [Tanacetum cinerariifolium]